MDLYGRSKQDYVKKNSELFPIDNSLELKTSDEIEMETEKMILDHDAIAYNPHDEWVITSRTPRLKNPKNFKYQLTAPQLASLYVMYTLEKFKIFPTNKSKFYSVLYILRNKLGSGKTPITIALITMFPIPYTTKNHPVYVEMQKMPSAANNKLSGTRGLITRQFTTIMRPAIIFVGYNLLTQWENEIKKFNPKLKVFVIDGIGALKRFYGMVKDDKSSDLNKYNIILVKNKDITGEFSFTENEILDSTVDGKKIRKIYNVVGTICRNLCFTRLIVDDFDTIGVPGVATAINALATWVVSCTRIYNDRKIWHNREYVDIEGLVHNSNIMYYDILNNDLLYNTFSVRVEDEFSKAYNLIGTLKMYVYLYKNGSGGKVVELINLMAGDKVSAIMEALNGDAHEEAARLAGIESNDINHILKSLLNDNFERVKEASRILELFKDYYDDILENINDLESMEDNPDPEDKYFTRKDLRQGREVQYKYPGLKQILEEEKAKWQEEYDICSKSLEKFKSSVEDNKCMVCCLPLDDPDETTCILPCCHEMLHSQCATMGCQFSKQYIDGKYTIIGRCPFNKEHQVEFTKLTHIGKDINLNKLQSDNVFLESDEKKYPDEQDFNNSEDEKKDRDKYDGMIDIIRGVVPKEREDIDLQIPALMTGGSSLGEPRYEKNGLGKYMKYKKYSSNVKSQIMLWLGKNDIPRVLIFANYDESLNKIQKSLTKEHIKFDRLGGHQAQLNKSISDFQTGENCVLLINGTQHCAGLNLQMGTDLIFMHQVKESGLQSQIAGRIQRVGRECNSKMHWLGYENELRFLKAEYQRHR
jgi:hypothetical protein